MATAPLVPSLAPGAVGKCLFVIEYLLELFFSSDFYVTELNQSLFAGMHKQKAVCKQ